MATLNISWERGSIQLSAQDVASNLLGKCIDVAVGLIGQLYAKFAGEVNLIQSLEEELVRLDTMRQRIEALLRDADARRRIEDETVLLWLRDLCGLALDAEDLLELVSAHKLEMQQQYSPTTVARRSSRKRSWDSAYRCSFSVPEFFFRWLLAKEAKQLDSRLNDISSRRQRLRLQRGDAVRVTKNSNDTDRQEGSVPDDKVVGMADDKKKVVTLLNDASHPSPKVVAITGMVGSGKTTVARCAFNDGTKTAARFDKKIWVNIATSMEHGAESIIREILESLGEGTRFCNFDTSQRRLRDLVSEKKVLIVLDNAPESGLSHVWDAVRAPLRGAARGSVVLVTTRNERVAWEMGATADSTHRLVGLSEEEWLQVFNSKLGGDLDDFPHLPELARKIASRCQRSPMAAIYLGSLMSGSRDVEEWKSVLGETTSQRGSGGNEIRDMLLRSYELLPLHLKRCFASCAIFPDDHILGRDDVAKIWVALGVVQDNRYPEAVGGRYFDQLASKSFFNLLVTASEYSCFDGSSGRRFKIPKLLHGVARLVSAHECHIIGTQRDPDVDPSVPLAAGKVVRHMLRRDYSPSDLEIGSDDSVLDSLPQADHQRTFIMTKCSLCKLPENLFLKMPCLRVLDLSWTTIRELPDTIGDLKLLRYLNMFATFITKLPDSVTSLLNLQTLNLGDCYFLRELPGEMKNLTKLRHLTLRVAHPQRSNLTHMPPEMGKLTNLQTLSRFIVGSRSTGCGLDQLRSLSRIKGELWVSELDKVDGAGDAMIADLESKTGLDSLTLQWSSPPPLPGEENIPAHIINLAETTIGNFRPPPALRNLWINNYQGQALPTWLPSLEFLVSVRLSHCQSWTCLASMASLVRLKHLDVEGLHSITVMKPDSKRKDEWFQSLEVLTLRNMGKLESWFIYPKQLPNLYKLSFLQCPRLSSINRFPLALRQIRISGCGILTTLPRFPSRSVDVHISECRLLKLKQRRMTKRRKAKKRTKN